VRWITCRSTSLPGEILGVVGESGAGKSLTGARSSVCSSRPDASQRWNHPAPGERIDDLAPDAMRKIRGRKIGAIFQDPLTSLNPMLYHR
jgi:peptide/nickel transport system ATP-binding protein